GCGRSGDKIRELQEKYQPPHDFEAVDVAREEAVARWCQRLLKEYGPPDLLINNAAVMNRMAPLWEITAREMEHMVQVNVLGVAHVIRHMVP
ncbi:MAG TPA: SDR family oxidoreductase, partial [Gemmatales bacterium]|nr:SDR family oxidoreductase [Gemmatales bacterium]